MPVNCHVSPANLGEINIFQNLAIIERFYGDLPIHYGASLLSISIDTVR